MMSGSQVGVCVHMWLQFRTNVCEQRLSCVFAWCLRGEDPIIKLTHDLDVPSAFIGLIQWLERRTVMLLAMHMGSPPFTQSILHGAFTQSGGMSSTPGSSFPVIYTSG